MTEQRPIFVYGTLRPGCGNDGWVWRGRAEATDDGECWVVGYCLVTNGGFPYLIRAATGQTTGCLIWPHARHYDDVLSKMDALEGVPAHYLRVTVPVLTEDGTIATAWTYVPAGLDDGYIATLPDVAVNDEGFYDWKAEPRVRRYRQLRGTS